MSTISTIYDNIYSVLGTLFPTKIELMNPYDVEDNDELTLSNGFGVNIGGALKTEELQGPIMVLERDIGIIFTKKVYRTEKDKTIRKTAEKALLEDVVSIVKEVENNRLITKVVEFFEFTGDDGKTFVFNDRQDIITMTASFKIRYSEYLK